MAQSKRKAANQRERGIPFGVLLVATLFIALLIFIVDGTPLASPSASATPTPSAPLVTARSSEVEAPPQLPPEAEVRAFWARELERFFKEHVLKEQTEYALLNTQLRESRGEIRKRYGHDLAITMDVHYAKAGWRVMMGSHAIKGQPTVELIIPSLMILHRKCAPWGHDARRAFELAMLVGFLYELDHLVLGEVGKSAPLESERRTWARTCERTVRPLIEAGAPVEEGFQRSYAAWVAAGRSMNNPAWDRCIRASLTLVK